MNAQHQNKPKPAGVPEPLLFDGQDINTIVDSLQAALTYTRYGRYSE